MLALGDTGYDGLLPGGQGLIDTRLEQLGARRVIDRVDCDVDYDDPAAAWIAEALAVLADLDGAAATAAAAGSVTEAPAKKKSKWTRKNPYRSVLAVNRLLSGPGSAKDIRHYEFALGDRGPTYAAGDAWASSPTNDPALVGRAHRALRRRAGARRRRSPAVRGAGVPTWRSSRRRRTCSTSSPERAPDSDLARGVHSGGQGHVRPLAVGQDVLELLEDGPQTALEEFLPLLRPLQHRSYSISSSPLAAPDRVA